MHHTRIQAQWMSVGCELADVVGLHFDGSINHVIKIFIDKLDQKFVYGLSQQNPSQEAAA